MDHPEASGLLARELRRYRAHSYVELQRLLKTQDTFEVSGASGVRYQVEVQAFWDDRPKGNLRLLGSIDDMGPRAFAPLSAGFIIAPTGVFVDE